MRTRGAWTLLVISFAFGACTYAIPEIEDEDVPPPLPSCSDGVKSADEFCDDGNTVDGDGCDSNCTITGCGNGILTTGETCDDGNTNDLDECTNSCVKGICGDGIKKSTEECDDGNLEPNDECDPNCRPPGCGNGFVGGGEICDDGNTVNGDTCNSTCSLKGLSTLFVGQPGVAGTLDGTGNEAQLNSFHSMALWGDSIYLANRRVVRVVDINTRSITTIAGSEGAPGYVDSLTGAEARFADIRGITTDGTTIWVGDSDNHVIRAISAQPPYAVTTVAGMLETSTGTITIADGGPGAAHLDSPRAVTYLEGLVYFLEPAAAVLRVFNTKDSIVTTLAGSPSTPGTNDGVGDQARFQGPRHMVVAGSASLYIADTAGYKIRAYDTVSRVVTTVAGTASCGYSNGSPTQSNLYDPRGMAFDGSNLYFAEEGAHTIRQLQLQTMALDTLSGTPAACTTNCSCGVMAGVYTEGSGSSAQWNYPYEMVYHGPTHALYVCDGGNHVIRKIE